MNDTRTKFEEIWPVPRGVFWDESEYMPCDLLDADEKYFELATEWDARLDTFTRCQESMGPVLSLVEEMVAEIEEYPAMAYAINDLMTRAKQIIGEEE